MSSSDAWEIGARHRSSPNPAARESSASGTRCFKRVRRWGKPVIPPKFNCRVPAKCDRDTSRWRHLIDNPSGRLKEYKGIVARCCKTDESFSAFIALAATVIRLSLHGDPSLLDASSIVIAGSTLFSCGHCFGLHAHKLPIPRCSA